MPTRNRNSFKKKKKCLLIMMAKGYGLDYVKREVKKNPKDFYKNLKQMAAAFPKFRNKPKDYKFESVIQEMISVKSSKEYFDNLDTINLIVRQANNLKGQLGKHPIKQNVNKLKVVKTMLKRGISPAFYAYEKDRSYSPSFKGRTDLNYIKKSLQDGKFRRAVSELMRAIDTRSYDSNEFYFFKKYKTIRKKTNLEKDLLVF